MKENILIGTSGWGYDEWVGPFYPKKLRKEDFLSYYSEVFYTNEINTTFYNIPSRRVVENWVRKTPENFLFSVKIPQTVTHLHKLDTDLCLDNLNYFVKIMKPLIESGKLLSFLIQLPPSFKKEKHYNNLKDFFDNWPGNPESDNYFLVVEFRDKSWMDDEIFHYLKNNKLTYCVVIEPLLPPRMDVTNPNFAYIRFHGYGKNIWFDYCFSEEEIKIWAQSIKYLIQNAKTIGIYFNNHFSGYATKNSLMLMKELEIQPKNSPEDVSILDIKKKTGEYSKGQIGLDKFFK
ncbi:hypothetical protein LCGC14_0976940 [marine sediment metagenome]|uniref:DUF72 domain-containing protein n=1 Tax=marine sediment metagenome TaxID=412755 RepID=A0A0F9RGH0_9ZZZZ